LRTNSKHSSGTKIAIFESLQVELYADQKNRDPAASQRHAKLPSMFARGTDFSFEDGD
jgi:hypothetical protein